LLKSGPFRPSTPRIAAFAELQTAIGEDWKQLNRLLPEPLLINLHQAWSEKDAPH